MRVWETAERQNSYFFIAVLINNSNLSRIMLESAEEELYHVFINILLQTEQKYSTNYAVFSLLLITTHLTFKALFLIVVPPCDNIRHDYHQ